MSGSSCSLEIRVPGHQSCLAFRPRNQTGCQILDELLGKHFAHRKHIENSIDILAINNYEEYLLSCPDFFYSVI